MDHDVFFASDNSLASTIVSQLKALKDAGHHPEVNVVAHFDPHVVNTPSQVFDINLVEKIRAKGEPHTGQDPTTIRSSKIWLSTNSGEKAKEKCDQLSVTTLNAVVMASRRIRS